MAWIKYLTQYPYIYVLFWIIHGTSPVMMSPKSGGDPRTLFAGYLFRLDVITEKVCLLI